MAEDDAENAFFQAQAMNADSVDYTAVKEQGADSSDSDDYDPSKTLQDQYSDSKPNENVPSDVSPSDANHLGASSVPVSDPDPSQPTGSAYPSQTPSQTASQASASTPAPGSTSTQPKTKTIGGFVVEDEDDEDDAGDADYEPPAVLGVEDMSTLPINVPQQPVSGNANQATSTPDVSLDEAAQESASAKNTPNSSFPSVVATAAAPSKLEASTPSGPELYNTPTLQSDPAQGSAAPTPAPDSPSAAKGRLPHDRVGMLEDRVQEDPRGDMAAWIELINEHRSRNRIDNARDVYERFLKVFPFSVRSIYLSSP
jgi:cleavage stimulation factor subunit 3